jgi:hypothetical protein
MTVDDVVSEYDVCLDRVDHGDVVCHVVCAFCAVSSGRRHSSYVDKYGE